MDHRPERPADHLEQTRSCDERYRLSQGQGATIDKAMTELRHGRGLVLTLVTLQ